MFYCGYGSIWPLQHTWSYSWDWDDSQCYRPGKWWNKSLTFWTIYTRIAVWKWMEWISVDQTQTLNSHWSVTCGILKKKERKKTSIEQTRANKKQLSTHTQSFIQKGFGNKQRTSSWIRAWISVTIGQLTLRDVLQIVHCFVAFHLVRC